jgi:hypothetical protein
VQPTTKTLARIACVTALGAIVAEPAIAETHYMQLYEDFATASCVNTVSCQVEFKRAVDHIKVLSVSCNFFNVTSDPPLTANVNGLALGRLASNGDLTIGQYLPVPTTLFRVQNAVQYQVIASTLHVVPKTWKPAVVVNFNEQVFTEMRCSISGQENNP